MIVLPPHNSLGPAPIIKRKTKRTYKQNKKRTRLNDKRLISDDIANLRHVCSISYEQLLD